MHYIRENEDLKNEMIDNGVDRLIDDLNDLNEEAEQFIDEIEHMSVEEEKI